MHKLKINNSLDVARWEKLPCLCDMNNETKCYPFVSCEHCNFQECWESVQKENFETTELDDNNNEIKRTVNEITLIRGKLDSIIGWIY